MEGCSPWGWTRLSDFTFTFHFRALEKEMATHSSVLAWRIPGTWEPGGLPSMGSHRVGHDWSDLAAAAAYDILGDIRVSLVVQWLRIHLLMQVQSLVWEDPTFHGTTKPEHHIYWATRVWELQLLRPSATTTEACMCRACAPQLEKPPQ